MQCKICDKPRKQYKNGIQAKTCGNKECINKMRKITNMEKYGHECNLHSKEGKMQVKETLHKKYGEHITNISQLPEVKQLKKETCFKNFGVDHPMQSSVVMGKSKKTLMARYGVDNISKVEEIIKKIQETKNTPVDKFFGLTPLQFGLLKIKETNLKKYGVDYYFQTDEFKKQYIKIMLERYGADNFFKSDKFNEMMIEQGFRYSNKNLGNLVEYKRLVRIFTERSYLEYKSILETDFKRSTMYHLDHIYSISAGFKNKIKPEIIGSICNLQILPNEINISKSDDCWITETTLSERYRSLNKKLII